MGTKVTIQAENYEPQLQAAIDAAKRLIEFTGKGVIISIETKHGKRSMNQNSLMWVIFTHIANCFNEWSPGHKYTKEDAHDYMVDARFGVQTKAIGKRIVTQRKQTKDMLVGEACEFIEWMFAWCAERGKPVPLSADQAEWWESFRNAQT